MGAERAVGTAAEELGALLDEIRTWRGNIEEHFSQTDLYARLEACEELLDGLTEELIDVTWPQDDDTLPTGADDGFVPAEWIARVDEDLEQIRETLARVAEEADAVEFPTAFRG